MTVLGQIACALPADEVTNADLQRENPSWDMDLVSERTGVKARRASRPGETAFDLSVRACEALAAEGVDLEAVDGILYCTQTPDYPMPGNAYLLHGHLGLGDDVFVLDYDLACSGFVYGVAIADAFLRSGLASDVLLVTAETYYTQVVGTRDRSTRTVFGDGAAVTRLSNVGDGGRVAGVRLGADGAAAKRVHIPGGGARLPVGGGAATPTTDSDGNVRTPLDMRMDGRAVWAFGNSVQTRHVRDFVASLSLELDDIDLFVFHQASRMVLESFARALEIPAERVFTNLERIGNLSAASIPFALRDALAGGAIGAGDRVLLSASGAGMSYGSVLVEY